MIGVQTSTHRTMYRGRKTVPLMSYGDIYDISNQRLIGGRKIFTFAVKGKCVELSEHEKDHPIRTLP